MLDMYSRGTCHAFAGEVYARCGADALWIAGHGNAWHVVLRYLLYAVVIWANSND
jgi:hypothetical protein